MLVHAPDTDRAGIVSRDGRVRQEVLKASPLLRCDPVGADSLNDARDAGQRKLADEALVAQFTQRHAR
eukprot:scaffold319383_cov30-Tisochrysis_lutea.AAC.1